MMSRKRVLTTQTVNENRTTSLMSKLLKFYVRMIERSPPNTVMGSYWKVLQRSTCGMTEILEGPEGMNDHLIINRIRFVY